MWPEIWTAVALVLVIEGLLPAIMPRRYRTMLSRMVLQPERVIRFFGFTCLLLGAVVMVCVHLLVQR